LKVTFDQMCMHLFTIPKVCRDLVFFMAIFLPIKILIILYPGRVFSVYFSSYFPDSQGAK